MPDHKPYTYVYVNADGGARELHADERIYLEAEFKGGDGNMPYIKESYEARDGWGEICGYLSRSQLPGGVTVAPAPAENPNRPLSREEYISWLRARGIEVAENPDGSMTMLPKPFQPRSAS